MDEEEVTEDINSELEVIALDSELVNRGNHHPGIADEHMQSSRLTGRYRCSVLEHTLAY